jgi:hypothetical protein
VGRPRCGLVRFAGLQPGKCWGPRELPEVSLPLACPRWVRSVILCAAHVPVCPFLGWGRRGRLPPTDRANGFVSDGVRWHAPRPQCGSPTVWVDTLREFATGKVLGSKGIARSLIATCLSSVGSFCRILKWVRFGATVWHGTLRAFTSRVLLWSKWVRFRQTLSALDRSATAVLARVHCWFPKWVRSRQIICTSLPLTLARRVVLNIRKWVRVRRFGFRTSRCRVSGPQGS